MTKGRNLTLWSCQNLSYCCMIFNLHEQAYGFCRKQPWPIERTYMAASRAILLFPYTPLWHAEDNFTSTYGSKECDMRHRHDSRTNVTEYINYVNRSFKIITYYHYNARYQAHRDAYYLAGKCKLNYINP